MIKMKRYINVAYKDRDMAKRLGARWDPSVKRWYCPAGSALAKAYSWRTSSKGGISASAAIAANSNVNGSRGNPQLSLLG
jgi:hypothetical protein